MCSSSLQGGRIQKKAFNWRCQRQAFTILAIISEAVKRTGNSLIIPWSEYFSDNWYVFVTPAIMQSFANKRLSERGSWLRNTGTVQRREEMVSTRITRKRSWSAQLLTTGQWDPLQKRECSHCFCLSALQYNVALVSWSSFYCIRDKSAAEKRRQLIQESKFLGGDMEHTHLVKGLDFALLQKVSQMIQSIVNQQFSCLRTSSPCVQWDLQ